MSKKQNKHPKTQKLTKRYLAEKRHRLRFWWASLAGVAFAVSFFNIALSVSGGWDDINSVAVLISMALAVTAMAIAGISVFKYQAQRFEVVAPLGVLIVSAVFYLTVALVNISFAVAAI